MGAVSTKLPIHARVENVMAHNDYPSRPGKNYPQVGRFNNHGVAGIEKFGASLEHGWNWMSHGIGDAASWVGHTISNAVSLPERAITTLYADVKGAVGFTGKLVSKAEDKVLDTAGTLSSLPSNALLIGGVLVGVLLLNAGGVGRGINSATGGGIRYVH
jgi:hypothetical protein